jgi:uncharacterized membrane protein YdfJ with MMPL/SSD domain
VVAGSGSGGQQIQDIGLGLALGILMDTFLVRTLLVPSTVVLLGRWNWWPSRMSRLSADQPLDAAPGGTPAPTAPGTPASPADPADPAGQQPRQPDRLH